MATLGTTALTLADWARRTDTDGKTAIIVDLLSQANEILDDMRWLEGNLETGHKTTAHTSLPQGTWRPLNVGVANTKSTTAQIIVACGNLEAYSVIDKHLADLNGKHSRFPSVRRSPFLRGPVAADGQAAFLRLRADGSGEVYQPGGDFGQRAECGQRVGHGRRERHQHIYSIVQPYRPTRPARQPDWSHVFRCHNLRCHWQKSGSRCQCG
jgi:hypothetical protein